MTTTIPLNILANEDLYSNFLAKIEQDQGATIDFVVLGRGGLLRVVFV